MKKDNLNSILCLGLMALAGSCIIITKIQITNNSPLGGRGDAPQVVNNSKMDLCKADTISIKKALPLKTKKLKTWIKRKIQKKTNIHQ